MKVLSSVFQWLHGAEGFTMRRQSLLFLSLLVPAFLVLGGYAGLKAQTAHGKRWSDAATWPDKKVPGKDAVVTIEKGMDVVLDVSPPPLHGLTINGKLSFADKTFQARSDWLRLQVASQSSATTIKPWPS